MAKYDVSIPSAFPDENSDTARLDRATAAHSKKPKSSDDTLDLKFEIGHVLFIDIVGYSRLLINAQSEVLQELNEIVRTTRQFQSAETQGKLVRLPTGDGMALVFRNSPEEPAQCALEISDALKTHPHIQLRMGIHSGPVNEVVDVNQRANIAGAGINMAQRVMDCGEAGHILVSKHVAEDLEHYARWQPHLHHLGEYEVKHSNVVSLVNLYRDDLGNPKVPQKIAAVRSPNHAATRETDDLPPKRHHSALLILALTILGLSAAFWLSNYSRTSSSKNEAAAATPALPNSPIPEKSIAVLPFENLSANQETAFFTDGVQDEILSDLAKVADLKVISRTSVMQYRLVRSRNLREIGRQLGVAHILEGSVQRAGNRIRVNAQLIDARTDAHIWAQVYDRELADVFAIQTEIARKIADQLQAHLSPKEKAALDAKPTENLAAYELYLRATQIDRNRATTTGSGGAEESKREVALLEKAVEQDPSFLRAICLLAQTHLYLHWINADQSVDHLSLAKKALEAATRLQPDGAGIHLTKAIFHYWGSRDYASALAELAQARQNLPNDVRVLFFTAMIERRQNNWTDATRRLEQALALDPANISIISELAATYAILWRYNDAAKTLDNALAWKPNDFGVGLLRASIDFFWKADLRRWKELVEGEAAKTADPNDLITARVDLAMLQRDYRTAEQLLTQGGGTEVDDNGFFTPREWKQAIIARGLGDQSKATAALLSARERVASIVRERPQDAKALMVLGQIDAAMGRKEDALREAQQASELLPAAKDAINGYQLLTRLNTIYAQVGEIDRALDAIEKGSHQPYAPTYGSLKLDQVWDPLRAEPRFMKIVESQRPTEK